MRPDALADALVKRLASLGDPATRVALARSILAALPPAELHEALRLIAARAGMRETDAQRAHLALGEALADREPHGAGVSDPAAGSRVTARELDWGTGRPLTLGERKSLARRSGRALLDRALRDAHPDVVAEVLINPRLTEGDVARMCAAPRARPECLTLVYRSARWATRPRVRRALAGNPATPEAIALSLVPLLARAELRELAGDARLANAVRARALEVLRRLPPTPPVTGDPH